jgi:hypothetical protein
MELKRGKFPSLTKSTPCHEEREGQNIVHSNSFPFVLTPPPLPLTAQFYWHLPVTHCRFLALAGLHADLITWRYLSPLPGIIVVSGVFVCPALVCSQIFWVLLEVYLSATSSTHVKTSRIEFYSSTLCINSYSTTYSPVKFHWCFGGTYCFLLHDWRESQACNQIVSGGKNIGEVPVFPKRQTKKKLNSVTLLCERSAPTERPPLVGEVSANFCW